MGEPPPTPHSAARQPEGSRPALGAHRRPPGSTPAQPPRPRSSPPGEPGSEPASATTPTGLPSRDELTEAWGDRILAGLRPGVRVYFAPGRFVAVDDAAAVFALPDQGLLTRAQPLRGEAEGALEAAFGRRVPLRLVVDDGVVPVGGAHPPDAPDDPSEYDFESLEDAGAAVVSPEQRLLEAFPGAEEIAP